MFPLEPTARLLTSIAEGTITLTNIIVQFPIALAYEAAQRPR